MTLRLASTTRRWLLKRAGQLAAGTVAAVALAAPMLAPTGARAAWPERPVKIIVPFAAGGPTDVIARIMGAALQEKLPGSAFVIENKGGAGGNIGIGAVAKAAPDGYTLLISSSAFVLNPSLYAKIPYDPIKDFAPIADLGTSTNVFVARPDLGVKSIADLVALARKEPDKLNYASPGIGTTPMLSSELLKVREKIQMAQVVHPGAAPAVQSLLAGTVPVGCVALPPAQPHIKSGKLVGLAVTGERRWMGLPDVPTMTELGYKDFVLETAQLFLAPAGTPKTVIDTLAKASVEILARPDIKEKLNAAGFDVNGRGPEALAARIAKEVPLMKEIVTQAGVKPR